MPPHTIRTHLYTHRHTYHLALTLVLILSNILTFSLGVVAHDRVIAVGGAVFSAHTHIPARRAYVLAGGGAGLPASASLVSLLPPVLNQGNSNACGAFSVAAALYGEMVGRGERPQTLSPWWYYWNVTYGANNGTTFDAEALAAERMGSVAYTLYASFSAPPGGLAPRSYGGSYEYVFYQPQGWTGIDAIRGALLAGHPVVILLSVNSEMLGDFGGQSYTTNTGSYQFRHFVVVYGYDSAGLWLQNSWGSGFGVGGRIEMSYAAAQSSILAAGIVHPGAVGWPAPAPLPIPPTVPTAQPTARPTPLPQHTTFLTTSAQHPRTRPLLTSTGMTLIGKGRVLGYAGGRTPHWVRVVTARRPKTVYGWYLTRNLRCRTLCARWR